MSDNPRLDDSRMLADLFDDRSSPIWTEADLAAVFRHQMSAPVTVGLHEFHVGSAAQFAAVCDARGLLLKSFADLFAHPNPPLELLQMTKRFAKAMRNHPDAPLPAAVANVIYYAAIAAALVRQRSRITELSDRALRQGLTWSSSQPWIDAQTQTLLKAAVDLLAGGGEVPR